MNSAWIFSSPLAASYATLFVCRFDNTLGIRHLHDLTEMPTFVEQIHVMRHFWTDFIVISDYMRLCEQVLIVLLMSLLLYTDDLVPVISSGHVGDEIDTF